MIIKVVVNYLTHKEGGKGGINHTNIGDGVSLRPLLVRFIYELPCWLLGTTDT